MHKMDYKTEKGKEIMLYPHGLSLPMDKKPSDNALKIIQEGISYLELMDEPQGSGCIFFNDDYYCQKTPGGKGYAWCVTYLWDIFRMCGLSHLFYDGGSEFTMTALVGIFEIQASGSHVDELCGCYWWD